MEQNKPISKDLYYVYEYELYQFARLTNLHGLSRWREARSRARIFWGIVGIAVITFSLYQVGVLFSLYFTKPTAAEIRQMAPKNGLEFPVVTLCNYNPVKASVAAEYKMDQDVLEYVLMSYTQPGNLYNSYTMEEVQLLHQQYENYCKNYTKTGKNFDLQEFFWNAGPKCEEMIMSCTFGGTPFNCCQSAEPLFTDMGKCYRFTNYGTLSRRQLLPGAHYGFQAFLNIELDEYPVIAVREDNYNFGIRLSIQHESSSPYTSKGAFSVSPGNRLYASIVPTFHKLLPTDHWSQCKLYDDEDSEFGRITSRGSCQAACEVMTYLKLCNCVPLKSVPFEGQPVCDPLQLYNCTHQIHASGNEGFWNQQCLDCSMNCERWTYEIQTSYVRIPAPGASINLQKKFNMTEDELARNVLAVTAYFTDIIYTEYEQVQAVTLLEIFSDIGGILSLFLGFSVVTFFEMLIFIFKVSWGLISKKRRELLLIRENLEALSKRKGGLAPSPYRLPEARSWDNLFIVSNGNGCTPNLAVK